MCDNGGLCSVKMAAAAAAALLDELMGRHRNAAPSDKVHQLNWEDPDYCKYYLVKFCPHDLFVNTRADLGACSKIHDDEVKKLFDQSSSQKKMQYFDEFSRYCSSILSEVHRKIEKGKQRLILMASTENVTLTPAQTTRNTEQITLLSDKINRLVEEAEAAGIQGNVEQAQGLMKLCDQLKEERSVLKKQVENSQWSQTASLAAEQQKQMEVCQVCGSFLIIGDAQQRIDDHLMGKQHVGYAKLKSAVDEINKEREKWREEREKARDAERRDRHGSTRDVRDRGERDSRDDRDRERDRGRDRDNDRKDRDRGRDRDRDRRRDDDRRDRGDRSRGDRRSDHGRDSRRKRDDDNDSGRRRRSRDVDRERERERDRDDSKRSRRGRSTDDVEAPPPPAF